MVDADGIAGPDSEAGQVQRSHFGAGVEDVAVVELGEVAGK